MSLQGVLSKVGIAVAILLSAHPGAVQGREPADPQAKEARDMPRTMTPGRGTAAPSDAIVLFDGADLSRWESVGGGPAKWRVAEGAFTVEKGAGDIRTKQGFGDCQLHIEWRTPARVEGEGQHRGNSGVFLQGRYEVQVLDSFDNPTYPDGQAASIYKQHAPLVNASRAPGKWQAYDIFFRAPRFSADGTLAAPAYVTVVHNGVLVQDHVEIRGRTVHEGTPSYAPHSDREPLVLQDHASPVSYRNVWIREL